MVSGRIWYSRVRHWFGNKTGRIAAQYAFILTFPFSHVTRPVDGDPPWCDDCHSWSEAPSKALVGHSKSQARTVVGRPITEFIDKQFHS